VATQNTVPPSDAGSGPELSNVNFEGLGLEASMIKGLKEALSYVEKIRKEMDKSEKASGNIAKNLSSKDSGSKDMGIGLGQVSSGFSTKQKVGLGALAVGSAMMGMAPNTMAAVTQRIAADTTAGISGMSANALIGQSNRLVGGGATSAMGPTMAAMGIMYQGGYTASSLSSKNIMSQLGGLSAISGGTNEQVAAALSQANGMNFLRAGISIRDPQGQLKAPNQMINDVYNFLYRGKNITAQQASMVYNPGSKGYSTIQQLAGGNQQLAGILQAGVVARARGGGQALTADTLGNAQKSLDLLGVGKDSPIRSMFKYNTSEANVLQNTQQGLVGGYNAALGGATDLNNAFASVASAAGGVTTALMGLKGFLQTFPGAGNVAGGVSGIASAAAGYGINALMTKAALSKLGVGKSVTTALSDTGAVSTGVGDVSNAISKGGLLNRFGSLGKFGKALPFVGTALGVLGGYQSRKTSGGGINWGSILKTAGTSAAITAGLSAWAGPFDPLLAAGAGLLSGGANLLGQLFAGGGKGGADGAPSSGTHSVAPSNASHLLNSPVPAGARITSGYGMRTYKNAKGVMTTAMHRGIDYGVVENTPLTAVDSGTVIKNGMDPNGYGNYLVVQHGNAKQSLYGHLNRVVANPGKRVSAGDIVAMSGGRRGAANSGNSTAPHLHFEYGSYVGTGHGQTNPAPLMKKGGWLSNLFNAVKGFLGFGPSPRGNTYGTDSNINMNKSIASGSLSSSDISSMIAGLTHGSGPVNYEDLSKHLSPSALKKISSQSIDYSSVQGGGKVSHKDLMTLLYRKGFKGKALDTAFSVSLAESGGRAGALGDLNLQDAKWGPSIGLFQIRSLKNWKAYNDKYRDGHRLPIAPFNAEAAMDKSTGGKNWAPWATFTSGKFAKFLADAAATKKALKIPSYDVGTSRVPADQLALIHKDEMVIDAGTADRIRKKPFGVASGGDVHIYVKMDVNIAQASPQEAERMVHVFSNSLERKLKQQQIGMM
jgi:murein DD-endopeptidase MepM/ murein hydrolase activator NlpD